MIGRTVGRYRIVAKLGQGGMGSVWKAHDGLLGRTVALKILPDSLADSPDARRRLLREARAASALDHSGIATVFDAGEADGLFYIAVACVDGSTVSAIAAQGPVPLAEALRVAIAVAEVLAHAHDRGVIHRDITGRNVIVAAGGRVVVLDFGLALPEGTTRLTGTGAAVGTVAYMAPEVVQGQTADARSDLYGLGVLLYEMLTGTVPFTGPRPEAVLYAAVHESPEPPGARRSGIPTELNRIVLKALAKVPERRYQTAGELISDLSALDTTSTRRPTPDRPGTSSGERSRDGPTIVADRPTEPMPTAKCLAILPFQDLCSAQPTDARAQVFTSGLAETVSASLANRTSIQVIPPSAAAPGTFLDEDLRRIARNLGANLLLRGSVHRSRDHLRITYFLLQADRCVQIAGDTLDGSLRDLFALEDQLVESVVRVLQLKADAGQPKRAAVAHDPAAHERYLQALGYLHRFEDVASIDGAVALLEQLLSTEGDAAHIHAALGRAYLMRYRLTRDKSWQDRAAAACERGIRLDPRSPDVLMALGHLNTSLGRASEAVRDFQQALKLRRDFPDALLGLSEAYEAAGKIEEAEQACREAIAQRPQFWGGYNRLGILHFSRAQYERAIEPWKRVVELTPDNVRGLNNLGAAFFQMGRYRDALVNYHRSIEILPNATAYTSLGTVHFFLENYSEAAAMFEKGAALRPGDPRMWGNLGDSYRWTPGLEEKAATTLDRAIELQRDLLRLNPKDAEGWSDLAGWLAKRGCGREAIRAIQRALKLNPADVSFMAAAGRVYHLAGNRTRALEWLGRAVEQGYSCRELVGDPELRGLRALPAFRAIVRDEQQNPTGI